MAAVITLQAVSKGYANRHVLTDVSFALEDSDRIALVGVNGSGKSTLLRLIAAAAQGNTDPNDAPDSGVITKKKGLTFEYVSQEPVLVPTLSIEATLSQGLRLHAASSATLETLAHEVHALAASLGLVGLDREVGNLSIGERRRVALGRALLSRPDVLALDEPTNHLDANTVDWLEQQLLAQPGALILVTHDRYFLDRVATRILEIDRGRIYSYGRGYENFLEKQCERLDNATERERIRRSFVRREIEWIRRGPKARTTKQKARIERFDDAVSQGKTNKEIAPDEKAVSLQLPPGPRLGKTIVETKNLTKSLGGKALFSNLTFMLKPKDRIGIVGPNGAGKTTLVRTLLGQLKADSGDLTVGPNTQFAFLDQGRADLDDDKSVLEEVAGDSDQVFLHDGPIHVRSFLRMFLFDDGFADMKIGKLSGGERNRVQLSKLLREGGNVLVLDEPTNDLDLITLGVLENALTEFPGCALVVSHDRWFLDRVATGILAFEGSGRVTFYEGSYSSYLEKWGHLREQPAGAPKSDKTETAAKASADAPKLAVARPKKLSFKDQRELDMIESTLATAEAHAAELEATLADPDVYAKHGGDTPALYEKLEKARAEVERIYARWQELESMRTPSNQESS